MRRSWVSPQISHYLWCLFRLGLQAVGAVCLVGLHLLPAHGAFFRHTIVATLFHILSTVPVAAQSVAQLVRTAVNLTQRRRSLGQARRHHRCRAFAPPSLPPAR